MPRPLPPSGSPRPGRLARFRRALAAGRSGPAVVGLDLGLTLLMWGLFAADRGFFQDDVALLAHVDRYRLPVWRFFFPILATSTRFLQGWTYALATLTPDPRLVCQLEYGLLWLGIGIAARQVAQELFPGRRWLAVAAGALTLTASSDFLTNSTVALTYNQSILAFLLAVVGLARFWRGAGYLALLASLLALLVSLFSTDAAFVALLLVPPLLWVVHGFCWDRRARRATLAWYAAAVPYYLLFARLLVVQSYLTTAIQPLPWSRRAARLWDLLACNFTPWQWALGRSNWMPAPPPLLGTGFRLGVTALGAAAFVAVSWALLPQAPEGERPPRSERRRFLFTLAAVVALAAAANAPFVSAPIAEFHYRTQLLSRVWASIAVAAASWAFGCWVLRRPRAAVLVPLGFVACGLYAGIERQDYYLGYWNRHRRELASIVEPVPGLDRSAVLVLHRRATPPYLATEVPYLAEAWLQELWGRNHGVLVWVADACQLQAGGLACPGQVQDAALPLSRLVILDFDPASDRYALRRSLPGDGRAGLGAAPLAGYAPEPRIVRVEVSRRARRLLAGADAPRLLGWVPLPRSWRPPAAPSTTGASPGLAPGGGP